jgi:hypothetical protein
VQLDGRQVEVARDFCVLDLERAVRVFVLEPVGGVRSAQRSGGVISSDNSSGIDSGDGDDAGVGGKWKGKGEERGDGREESGTHELAMALPQPNVLNLASSTSPFLPNLICSFITSPHAGAPTRPVPTKGSFLSSEPTLRGLS